MSLLITANAWVENNFLIVAAAAIVAGLCLGIILKKGNHEQR